MFIQFAGILIMAIFIGLLFSVYGERSKKDLDAIIEFSNDQIIQAKKIIKEQYKMEFNEALAELEKAKSAIYDILRDINKLF